MVPASERLMDTRIFQASGKTPGEADRTADNGKDNPNAHCRPKGFIICEDRDAVLYVGGK
jgi:hypothetical protein